MSLYDQRKGSSQSKKCHYGWEYDNQKDTMDLHMLSETGGIGPMGQLLADPIPQPHTDGLIHTTGCLSVCPHTPWATPTTFKYMY